MIKTIAKALRRLLARRSKEFEDGRQYARAAVLSGRGHQCVRELRSALEDDDFTRGMAHELRARGLLPGADHA